MSKKNCDNSCKKNNEQFKTMIGGQALIEGIMMLGPTKSAIVLRTKNGLKEKIEDRKKKITGFSLKQLPFIRGIFNFWTSMKMGVSATMYSADVMIEDETEEAPEEQSKVDKWLDEKLSTGAFTTIAVILGILMSVGLFVILPSFIGSYIQRWIPNEIVHNLVPNVICVKSFVPKLKKSASFAISSAKTAALGISIIVPTL